MPASPTALGWHDRHTPHIPPIVTKPERNSLSYFDQAQLDYLCHDVIEGLVWAFVSGLTQICINPLTSRQGGDLWQERLTPAGTTTRLAQPQK